MAKVTAVITVFPYTGLLRFLLSHINELNSPPKNFIPPKSFYPPAAYWAFCQNLYALQP